MISKTDIAKTLKPLVRMFVVLAVLVMAVYPLLVLGLGQAIFPAQSNGSPMVCNGVPVGSALIAQNVTSPMLFHSRNQSTSASGVDPDITPADAYAQIPRIGNATGIPDSSLRYLVNQNIQKNAATNVYVLAPPYVNVNEVNLELVQLYPQVYAGFCTAP